MFGRSLRRNNIVPSPRSGGQNARRRSDECCALERLKMRLSLSALNWGRGGGEGGGLGARAVEAGKGGYLLSYKKSRDNWGKKNTDAWQVFRRGGGGVYRRMGRGGMGTRDTAFFVGTMRQERSERTAEVAAPAGRSAWMPCVNQSSPRIHPLCRFAPPRLSVQSVCPSVCQSACQPVCQPVCPSICQSVCQPVYVRLSVSQFVSLPVRLSVSLFVSLPVRLSASQFVSLSVCLSVCLSACLSVSQCVRLFVSLSTYLSVCQPVCVRLSVSQFVSLSVCLSVCLSACLSVCLPEGMLLSYSSVYPGSHADIFDPTKSEWADYAAVLA